MGYLELGKMYYGDKVSYRAEYEARFSSPDTIKLNFWIKSNQVFFCSYAGAVESDFPDPENG